MVTCSDSRVVPDLLASTDPGDLFVMRNVGNLIPPATAEGISIGDLSEASAIEYAVLVRWALLRPAPFRTSGPGRLHRDGLPHLELRVVPDHEYREDEGHSNPRGGNLQLEGHR
jgi:Carbonic anhydrase